MLVLLLPTENADILCHLLKMLHQVSMNEDTNKMNAMNLGIVLAPHILCPRKVCFSLLFFLQRIKYFKFTFFSFLSDVC